MSFESATEIFFSSIKSNIFALVSLSDGFHYFTRLFLITLKTANVHNNCSVNGKIKDD